MSLNLVGFYWFPLPLSRNFRLAAPVGLLWQTHGLQRPLEWVCLRDSRLPARANHGVFAFIIHFHFCPSGLGVCLSVVSGCRSTVPLNLVNPLVLLELCYLFDTLLTNSPCTADFGLSDASNLVQNLNRAGVLSSELLQINIPIENR
jgi:hypothetical protein